MNKKSHKKKKQHRRVRTPDAKNKENYEKNAELDEKPSHEIEEPRGKCYDVLRNDVMGRYLVANRPIAAGEEILSAPALVVGPTAGCSITCLGCYLQLPACSIHRCPGCAWPLCGPTCGGLGHNLGHSEAECRILATIPPQYDNLQKLTDQYYFITPLRCLLLKSLAPSSWAVLRSMESHDAVRRSRPDIWLLNQRTVVDVLLPLMLATEEEVHTVCGVLEVNAFEVGGHENSARALFPLAFLLSHACVPTTSHAECGGAGGGGRGPGGEVTTLTVRAATDHARGDALTLSYAYTLQGTLRRRAHLQHSKFFWCVCARCSDKTELGTYASALVCPHCGTNEAQKLENQEKSTNYTQKSSETTQNSTETTQNSNDLQQKVCSKLNNSKNSSDSKTNGSAQNSEHLQEKCNNSSHKSQDSRHKSPDSSHKSQDSSHKSQDSSHKSEDSSLKSGDSSNNLRSTSGNNLRSTSGNNLRSTSGNNLRSTSGNNLRSTSGNNLRSTSGNNLRSTSGINLRSTSDIMLSVPPVVLPVDPLHMESEWKCSHCSYTLKADAVDLLLKRLTDDLDSIDANDVKGFELFLNTYRNVLHHNHYLNLSAKHSLSQLYGKVTEYMIGNMSEGELLRKVEICRDLMTVFDVIEPGLSRLRGITLYELHAPLMVLTTREFERKNITKDNLRIRLKEVVHCLTEAAAILSLEPPDSSEGMMAAAAAEALSKIYTWEQIIGKIR